MSYSWKNKVFSQSVFKRQIVFILWKIQKQEDPYGLCHRRWNLVTRCCPSAIRSWNSAKLIELLDKTFWGLIWFSCYFIKTSLKSPLLVPIEVINMIFKSPNNFQTYHFDSEFFLKKWESKEVLDRYESYNTPCIWVIRMIR